MRKSFNDAPRGMKSTPTTWGSKLTLALDCTAPSSGSSSSTRGLLLASVMTMAQGLLPTSSRYMLSPWPHPNQSNHYCHGSKPSSWGHPPCITTSSKLLGNSRIRVSKLTYRDFVTPMPYLWKLTTKSRNGKHVQQPLHMLANCARVVWKLCMLPINLECSKIWDLYAPMPNSLTMDATSHWPLCVVATM